MFELDYYNQIVTPKVYLANPNKNVIGLLSVGNNIKFDEQNLNKISSGSFKIYAKKNDEPVKYYDRVLNNKLIKFEGFDWYQITNVEEHNDGLINYKDVSFKSLENELTRRNIANINGVYSLYDVGDTENSLLHIITKELHNTWTIGHIDSELIGKYRTFAIDSTEIYTLLVESIATSFNCMFSFNTELRQINAYDYKNIGEETNILLSYKNLVKEGVIEDKQEDIVTAYRVKGGDDLDIRAVNFGSDVITNLSYFKVKESDGGWMSDGLVDAYDSYIAKCNTLTETNNTLVATLKTKYEELNKLNESLPDVTKGESETDWTKYGYNQLEIKFKEHDIVATTYAKNGDSNPSSAQYSLYLAEWNIIQAIKSEMAVRQSQIDVKNTEISAINTSLDNIANQISRDNNFTNDQLIELGNFLNYGEYSDETYCVAETDTDVEKLNIQNELKKVATEDLARVSYPQFTFTMTLENLFKLNEYKSYRDKFKLGNIVTIKFRDDFYVTARLLSFTDIDFNDLSKISVTISNKNKLDSEAIEMKKILNQAETTNNVVAGNLIPWDRASKSAPIFQDYMTKPLNLATQDMINSKFEELTWGNFGMRCKRYIEATKTYDVHESWFNSHNLLFSDDNFKTSRTGIGVFDDGSGNKRMGFMGECVVSNIILSNYLKVLNNAGTFTISNDGFIGSNGTNTVKINPNEQNIFQILKGTTAQFYIDVDGNVCSAGKITGGSISIGSAFSVDSNGHMKCVSGEFSGDIRTSSITASSFSAGTISIGDNFTVDIDGNMKCTSGQFSGSIISSTINVNDKFKVDISGNLTAVGTATFGTENEHIHTKTTIDSNGILVSYVRESPLIIQHTSIEAGSILTQNISCDTINADSHGHSRLYANSDRSSISAYFSPYGNFASDSGTHGDLGTSDNYWGTAYLYTAPTITSDRNAKNTIEDLTDAYIQLILKLKPVRFKYNNGSSHRFHTGYIAQDVESILLELGLSTQEFAGLIKSPTYSKANEYGEFDTSSEITGYLYSLRYEEFISPMVALQQKTNSELQDTKIKLNSVINENLNLKEQMSKLESDITLIKEKLLFNQ
jgi:hypothetical protein